MHELLAHLTAAGFDGAPRFLGIDERGRETLEFIPGEVTIDGPPTGLGTDEALTAAARLLRRLHDATVDLAAARPDGWRRQVGAPDTGPVVCHNDVGPYNAVYRAGRPIAFIDWDFAAPAPREWDVAYALWRFVPLYDDAACARLGWSVVPRGPRIARFLDAYGLDDRADVLSVVRRRQEVVRATVETWAAEGDPAFTALRREGRVAETTANIEYVDRMREEWEPFLR